MAFKYKNWMLFKREIILENGSKRTVHFFSKYRPFKGEPCDLPKVLRLIRGQVYHFFEKINYHTKTSLLLR